MSTVAVHQQLGSCQRLGYTNKRSGNGFVYREINEPEAATVRYIFTLYAEGAGLTRIAKRLNAEAVPSPLGGSGTWAGTAIRDMLHRKLYAGTIVWAKAKRRSGVVPRPAVAGRPRNGSSTKPRNSQSSARNFGIRSRPGSGRRKKPTSAKATVI
jgi:recombinase